MSAVLDSMRRAGAAVIEGPQDPALAKLWALALEKFHVQHEAAPSTRADWRAVTKDYSRLIGKASGSIAQVIEERCAEQPGGT